MRGVGVRQHSCCIFLQAHVPGVAKRYSRSPSATDLFFVRNVRKAPNHNTRDPDSGDEVEAPEISGTGGSGGVARRLPSPTVGVATRISLLFSLAGVLVVAVFGALSVRTERSELLRTVEQHMTLLGRVVQVSVENALRDEQTSDVLEIADTVARIAPDVSIHVASRAGDILASSSASSHALSGWARAHLLDDSVIDEAGSRYVVNDTSDGGVAWMFITLSHAPDPEGWVLILTRGLGDVEADLARTSSQKVLLALSLSLVMVIAGWWIGHVYIRRPLRALVEAIDELPEGCRRKVEVYRNDEFARVAHALERLVGDLDAGARERENQAEALSELQLRLMSLNRLAAIGQVAAGLAHEIGSPLQVLEGRAQMLVRQAEKPEETRRIAAILVSQAQRVGRIVSRLLGQVRARPDESQRVPLGPVVQEIVDFLAVVAGRHDVRLTTSIPRTLETPCSADRIQQILFNLISNAIQAMPEGGEVHVSATKREGSAADDELLLQIADSGPGLPPEVCERLFAPFVTTRADAGGVGLGLAVVRRLVHEVHGEITYESTPENGTTFEIVLPFAEGGRASPNIV